MDLVSRPENLFYVINFKNDFKIDVFSSYGPSIKSLYIGHVKLDLQI